MTILSSQIKVRILAALTLLVSVSFFVYQPQVYSQANNLLTGNTRDKLFRLTHPLNYHPESKKPGTYDNALFRSMLPETLNVYAVRVQFKGDNNSQTTGDGRFDVSSNYPDSVDAPPHDSLYFIYKLEFLKNYYYKASKGKLIINYTLFPGVRNLPNEMETYSPRRTENLSRMGNLFFDVWRSADSTIDFSGINPDNSAFMIFHAGVGRDVDLESQGLFVGQLDLPSIYMSQGSLRSIYGDTAQGYYTNEGLIIKNSCMLPEQEYRIINTSFGDAYLELGMNGIVVATIGSHLGLPDLFKTDDGTTAIGRFGLMDGQSIFSYLGVFPPEPSAWEKQYLGWIEPNTLYSGGTYTSKAASIDLGNESVYKILISGKEYFLVENRNRDANNNGVTLSYVSGGVSQTVNFTKDEDGFNSSDIWKLKGSITDVDELDWSLPGIKNDTANYQGGILVWHIDENVIDAKIGSNTINNDINHRGVDVEEAKGSQDIGVIVSTPLGDIVSDGFFVDFWYNGDHYRPSNIYRNEFNNTSFPNSKSYSNVNSRVCLSQFSQIGATMTFNYEVCGDVANINGFPRFVGKDISGNSQAMGFDFNGNGFDEMFVNVNDSLFGFRDNGNPIRVDMPNGYLKDSASSYAVGFLNYSLSGNTKTVVGVSGSKVNFITFNIDTNTAAPVVQSVDAGVQLTTPELFAGNINQANAFNTIYTGTQNGRIFKLKADSLTFSFDSVSNNPIRSLAIKMESTLPGSYSFIDNSNKYLASAYIYFGQPPIEATTMPVKITNDNRLIRKDASGNDTVISNNLGISTVNSTPTICDINGDGSQDIILTADNKIYAINKFGVVLDNFPLSIPNVSSITGGVAVADLNNDGIAEVIFGTGEGRLYAYSINGKVLSGFPLLTGGRIRSTPAIINSNGNFGILVYSEDGYLYGYRTEWAYSDSKILWRNFLRNAGHTNDGAGSLSPVTTVNQPCLPSDKVYNWPNPAYGKSTNIRYYLGGDVNSVNIKIMDLAGELVTTLSGTTHKGFENEVPWDISTVQSGIYIAVLELSGGCGETASIKIAVVK